MKWFVNTEDFRKLNVGLSLDEGNTSPDDTFIFNYGERSIWSKSTSINTNEYYLQNIFLVDVVIRCGGQTGHGSRLLDDTAGEKLTVVLEKFFAFRKTQKKQLNDDPSLKLGDVTTVNLTIIEVRISYS